MDEQEIILVSIHKPCPGCGEPVTIGASLCPICLENIGRDEGVNRKPLSAKADSFSLPDPSGGRREARLVYKSPTGDISRSDSVSRAGEPAGHTGE
jgi:hypothetical protein